MSTVCPITVMIRFTLLVFVSFSLACLHVVAASARSQPNIVLILVDDFGYECVGANGSTSYRTPVMDKLGSSLIPVGKGKIRGKVAG